MPVRGRRAHAGPARGICKREACGALLGNQFKSRAHQRLLEIAVMIAARTAPAVFRPDHVKVVYISRPVASMPAFFTAAALPAADGQTAWARRVARLRWSAGATWWWCRRVPKNHRFCHPPPARGDRE